MTEPPSNPKRTSIHVRLEAEEIRVIDDWRRAQEMVPSRTTACAHLIRLGWGALQSRDRDSAS